MTACGDNRLDRKTSFQAHGVDVAGVVVQRRRHAEIAALWETGALLDRDEACAAAHYWERTRWC